MSDLSPDDADDLKAHVRNRDTWVRFACLVLFGLAFYLTSLLVFASCVCQFLARLFSGATFPGLVSFGDALATYQAQLVRYLTFASDERPFPFAPFPKAEASSASPKEPE